MMARGSSSHSVLCEKGRWCNYYKGHYGPCADEPPQRDCTCDEPKVRSTWLGKDCLRCGRRITG